MTSNKLMAGAANVDITPEEAHFLHGYPFVPRTSTGTHDALLSSALYLTDGKERVLFISNDIIYVNKELTARIRQRITGKTGIPASNILIAATHTHSGPVTVDLLISESDPIVPKVNKKYLDFFVKGAVEAGVQAVENAVPAELAFVIGDATGVGTNRHNPDGAKDMEVPAMVLCNKKAEYIGCLLVCNMHPTILHEDSTLYSGDFPHFIRETLQHDWLGENCPVVYFTGTAGNQSPRHVTKENTFEEARRIGEIVANSLLSEFTKKPLFSSDISIAALQTETDLPKKEFPSVEWAEQNRNEKKERFESLKRNSDNPQETRTAEVNWFGSEELLFLAKKAQSNKLEDAYNSSLPAEIQVIKVGGFSFAAWSGEVFVEFGMELKKRFKNIVLITYANGELQGYITTKEANDKNFYEAGNSLFDYKSGDILIEKTSELLKKLGQ